MIKKISCYDKIIIIFLIIIIIAYILIKIRNYYDEINLNEYLHIDNDQFKEQFEEQTTDPYKSYQLTDPIDLNKKYPYGENILFTTSPEQNNSNLLEYKQSRNKYLQQMNLIEPTKLTKLTELIETEIEPEYMNQHKYSNEHQLDYINYQKAISDAKSNVELKYTNTTPKIDTSYFEFDNSYPTISCSNSSVNNIYRNGPRYPLPAIISCNESNIETAENFYRTHFTNRPIRMYDYKINGANYADYIGFTHPTRLNRPILSANSKTLAPGQLAHPNIPMPSNYIPIATNGPVVSMP